MGVRMWEVLALIYYFIERRIASLIISDDGMLSAGEHAKQLSNHTQRVAKWHLALSRGPLVALWQFKVAWTTASTARQTWFGSTTQWVHQANTGTLSRHLTSTHQRINQSACIGNKCIEQLLYRMLKYMQIKQCTTAHPTQHMKHKHVQANKQEKTKHVLNHKHKKMQNRYIV